MSRILIVEDEPRIAAMLEKRLRADGYSTTSVFDGRDAVVAARDESFDLMLLDLRLPGVDGHEVLRAVRARGERMPIVVLTACNEIDDTVAALQGGADDHVMKPFGFDELLARIRLRLRDGAATDSGVLGAGGIRLDLRTRQASVTGLAGAPARTVDLTPREFALAEVFVRHAGQVLSREQLLSHIWGYDFDPGSNVVDVYVRYLRQKLGAGVIETVRGMGYRLAVH